MEKSTQQVNVGDWILLRPINLADVSAKVERIDDDGIVVLVRLKVDKKDLVSPCRARR